ncbi:hypothetical protein [Pseudoxanthomonas putridarboris]|uniref:Uncharacterized protein n=1 Tax=Pseudoxanthomonas putridarboris TaxID=752605 RepID=A0ABU9J3C6_9GAMM
MLFLLAASLVFADAASAQSSSEMRRLQDVIAKRPVDKLVVPTHHDAIAGTRVVATDRDVAGPSQAIGAARRQVPGVAVPAGVPVGAVPSRPSGAQRLPAGLYSVALSKPEEQVASRAVQALQADPRNAGTAIAVFPNLIRDVGADQSVAHFKPYVMTGGPLKYQPQTGAFVGYLRVGVAAVDKPGSQELSAPLTFQVLEQDVASPGHVSLERTSPPYATINIATADAIEPFIVRVASQFVPDGVPVSFTVNPTLFLKLDRRTIQGYGLETTRVSVAVMGIENPKDRVVTLQADPSAHLASAQLRLDGSGHAETLLRSDGTGPSTITASMPGLANATAPIDYAPPWRTIIASALGGLLGGGVRLASTVKQSRRFGRGLIAILMSMLVGVMVLGLAVLGVNVLPISFPVRVGEVFSFIVSAVGAFVGVSALKGFVAQET